jgi:ketosteroid isomerase-like protein
MMLQTMKIAKLASAGMVHSMADPSPDEQEILRVEAELCRAFENADADALRAALDPTFVLTDSRGTVTGLEQNLAEVASGDPDYEVFRNHGQKVQLYGDAAIVTGITSIRSRSGDAMFEGDFQFTDTWIRRPGGWKLAASHASRLPGRQARQPGPGKQGAPGAHR